MNTFTLIDNLSLNLKQRNKQDHCSSCQFHSTLFSEFSLEFRKLVADIANLSFLLRSFTLDHPSSTAYLDFIFDSCQSIFRLQKRLALSFELEIERSKNSKTKK